MNEIFNKIFGSVGIGVADKLSSIVDKFVHTKDEKGKFQKEITQVWIEAEAAMEKNVTDRWNADMTSDNKLSKSVRPLVLIFLIIVTMLLIFVDSGFITFVVDDDWKELLKVLLVTVVASYFGGRSYEKGQKIKNKN